MRAMPLCIGCGNLRCNSIGRKPSEDCPAVAADIVKCRVGEVDSAVQYSDANAFAKDTLRVKSADLKILCPPIIVRINSRSRTNLRTMRHLEPPVWANMFNLKFFI